MIHWSNILQILGIFILILSATIGLVALFALLRDEPVFSSLALACVMTLGIGAFLALYYRTSIREFNRRDGIILVVFVWFSASFLGAFPFFFSGFFPSFTDAFFESISGFTATGATILEEIEVLPDSLLLWRSFIQWFGGMGIILLAIAILPLIGVGGIELYRAEFSGSRSERLTPRLSQTATSLWKLYFGFTLAEYLCLRWAGMNNFESICHSFTTMATGGFSTRNSSIQSFDNPTIEYILVIFMLLGGINFTRHYQLIVELRPLSFLRDTEFRFYCTIIVVTTAAVVLVSNFPSGNLEESFRQALFQVVSILTTTGYSSVNFGAWVPFCQLLLLALMFIGGCTGSTAGGLKVARVSLLFRVVAREFKRMVEPRGVFSVRFDGGAIAENTIQSLLNLIYLAFIINFSACLCLTFLGLDIFTSISSVVSSMFNIGPGLGTVGPDENYAHLPIPAKWILSFCMLAGRLEYYTLLVLLTKPFWRR